MKEVWWWRLSQWLNRMWRKYDEDSQNEDSKQMKDDNLEEWIVAKDEIVLRVDLEGLKNEKELNS